MRAITIALIVVSNLVVGLEKQIKIIYNIINPSQYISQLGKNDAWFAYKVKAQKNTASMCCWDDTDGKISQCNLTDKKYNYGSNSDSPITEHINIYVKVEQGDVKRIIPLGDQCEIASSSYEINWLNDVTQQSSVKWLKEISLEVNTDINSSALHSMALHKGKQATAALYDIAIINNDTNSENAVFWLGNTRNDGVPQLQKLLKNLPNGQVRRHINFALSQADSTLATKELKNIALKDAQPEQRADALFWLAQSNPNKAQKIILNILKQANNESQINNAVFTLSQIHIQDNDESLFQLLTGNYSSQVKKQALFWLSQSQNSTTIDKLQELL